MMWSADASYIEGEGWIMAFSPKAGSTSIKRAIPHMTRTQAYVKKRKKHGMPVYLFVRHPIERMVSAWNMFTNSPQANPGLPQQFESFVEWVVQGGSKLHRAADHWMPQTEYHTYSGLFLPSKTYRFDVINDVFPALTGRELEHANEAVEGSPDWWDLYNALPEELRQDLGDYYRRDLDLYDGSAAS